MILFGHTSKVRHLVRYIEAMQALAGLEACLEGKKSRGGHLKLHIKVGPSSYLESNGLPMPIFFDETFEIGYAGGGVLGIAGEVGQELLTLICFWILRTPGENVAHLLNLGKNLLRAAEKSAMIVAI